MELFTVVVEPGELDLYSVQRADHPMDAATAQKYGTDVTRVKTTRGGRGGRTPDNGQKIVLNMSGRDTRNDDDGGEFVRGFNRRVEEALSRDGYTRSEFRYGEGGGIIVPSVNDRVNRSLRAKRAIRVSELASS